MKKLLLTGLVASTLLMTGWAATNLLVNGSLLDCPAPSKMTGAEEHSNVWKAPLAVDASVPGFKVTRNQIYLVMAKKNNKRWLTLDGGGITQTVAVKPNQAYLLKFTLEGDPQGRGEQSVAIQAPGVNTSENVSNTGRRQVITQFTPTSDQAALEIYGTSSGRGPRVFDLSVEAQ